jgi:hypothetical protein
MKSDCQNYIIHVYYILGSGHSIALTCTSIYVIMMYSVLITFDICHISFSGCGSSWKIHFTIWINALFLNIQYTVLNSSCGVSLILTTDCSLYLTWHIDIDWGLFRLPDVDILILTVDRFLLILTHIFWNLAQGVCDQSAECAYST